jgi:hypothetical protein
MITTLSWRLIDDASAAGLLVVRMQSAGLTAICDPRPS